MLLGRFVCGWLCPLGSVHQFFSFIFKKTRVLKPRKDDQASLAPKYLILFVVLAATLLSVNLVGYLDPLSFLYRSFAVFISPLLNLGLSESGNLSYLLGLKNLGQTISQTAGNLALNGLFQNALLIGGLFLLAVLLNAR